jgi:hypothetical protein
VWLGDDGGHGMRRARNKEKLPPSPHHNPIARTSPRARAKSPLAFSLAGLVAGAAPCLFVFRETVEGERDTRRRGGRCGHQNKRGGPGDGQEAQKPPPTRCAHRQQVRGLSMGVTGHGWRACQGGRGGAAGEASAGPRPLTSCPPRKEKKKRHTQMAASLPRPKRGPFPERPPMHGRMASWSRPSHTHLGRRAGGRLARHPFCFSCVRFFFLGLLRKKTLKRSHTHHFSLSFRVWGVVRRATTTPHTRTPHTRHSGKAPAWSLHLVVRSSLFP